MSNTLAKRCRVRPKAGGGWEIKTPAGVVSFPTAGIDVGVGAAKGIVAEDHDLIRVIGDIVQIGNSVSWDGVRLYGCDSPKLETMADGVKFPLGSSGTYELLFEEAYVDIEAVAENQITLGLNKARKILGCHMRVDQALDGADRWDADYYDTQAGYGQNIATNMSPGQNVKANTQYDDFADSPVPKQNTHIKIRKNGGGNFIAQGRIRAIVYYWFITQMDDI